MLRCVLPFTVFLKLKDIGGNVLPPYDEEFREVAMDTAQAAAYRDLAGRLTQELKQALAKRDTTLLGVVLNVLLAWPDCCFRSETVVHPRTRNTLAFVGSVQRAGGDAKERELIEICKREKAEGRKTLVYSVYTGTRDTTSRLKVLLEQEGFKVAVLRASVDASRREDWIAEQLDRGIDVLITNPELVKTGRPAGVPDHRVPPVRLQRVFAAAGRPALMAHRPEAAGARDLPGLCQLLADDLPGVDGRKIMVSQKRRETYPSRAWMF